MKNEILLPSGGQMDTLNETLDLIAEKLSVKIDGAPREGSENAVQSGGVFEKFEQVNSAISGKSANGHSHSKSDINNLVTDNGTKLHSSVKVDWNNLNSIPETVAADVIANLHADNAPSDGHGSGYYVTSEGLYDEFDNFWGGREHSDIDPVVPARFTGTLENWVESDTDSKGLLGMPPETYIKKSGSNIVPYVNPTIGALINNGNVHIVECHAVTKTGANENRVYDLYCITSTLHYRGYTRVGHYNDIIWVNCTPETKEEREAAVAALLKLDRAEAGLYPRPLCYWSMTENVLGADNPLDPADESFPANCWCANTADRYDFETHFGKIAGEFDDTDAVKVEKWALTKDSLPSASKGCVITNFSKGLKYETIIAGNTIMYLDRVDFRNKALPSFDLDEITETGFYLIYQGAEFEHSPIDYGFLKVYANKSGSYILQIAANNDGAEYTRRKNASGWSEWNHNSARLLIMGDSISSGVLNSQSPTKATMKVSDWIEKLSGGKIMTTNIAVGSTAWLSKQYETAGNPKPNAMEQSTALWLSDKGVDLAGYDAVLLEWGLNDYESDRTNPNEVIGTVTDTGTDTVCGAIYTTLEHLYSLNPNITVILEGVPRTRGANGTFPNYTYWSALDDAIKGMAEKYHLHYISMSAWCGARNIPVFIPGTNGRDYTHPTEKGYEVMGRYLAGQLQSVIG